MFQTNNIAANSGKNMYFNKLDCQYKLFRSIPGDNGDYVQRVLYKKHIIMTFLRNRPLNILLINLYIYLCKPNSNRNISLLRYFCTDCINVLLKSPVNVHTFNYC